MDACQVFLKAGPFFRRIKTINVEEFMRPVRETTRSVQKPASHVGKTMHFSKIELAPSQLFFRPLAILDIYIGSVPFDDFPGFVSQWVGSKQEPTICAVKTTKACFSLSWFSTNEN